MKKSIIFGALASMMLFATSCQEELPVVEQGGEAVVSFNIEAPQLATRAFSKGDKIDNLKYAVYDHKKNIITDASLSNYETGIDFTKAGTTLNLTLTNGSTYTIILWASDKDNTAYSLDFPEKKVTVSYEGANCNDESRDAFFADYTFTVNGSQPVDITLTRPFAQLNIGTNDLDESATAQYAVTHTAVVASAKVPNIFHLLGDENDHHKVEGEVDATFALSEMPKGETFPVEGYEYLAMNYILANDAQETLIPIVTLKYSNDGTTTRERSFGQVPLRRNYRTNIYGSLLTNGIDVNVDINPDFNEETTTLFDLQLAAINGGTYTLTEDINLTESLLVQGDLTLDLNGKTITGNVDKSIGALIENEGTLRITGNGFIKNGEINGGAAINNVGTLVLDGATIVGAPISESGSYPSYTITNSGKLTIEEGTTVCADRGCLSLSGSGETTINGGTFTNNDINRTLTSHVVVLSSSSHNKLTINDGTFQHLDAETSGGVVICNMSAETVYISGGNYSGGNYYGQDNLNDYGYGYAKPFAVSGGVYTNKINAKYLAAGYKVVEADGKYMVVEENMNVVATAADLKTALTEGKSVVISSDITIESGIGNYLTTTSTEPIVIKAAPGTEVKIENYSNTGELNVQGLFDCGDITFEGITFNVDQVTSGWAMSLNVSGTAKVTLRDCTFSGVQCPVYQSGPDAVVTIEDCTFTGQGIQAEVYSGDFSLGQDLIIRNCDFGNITDVLHIYDYDKNPTSEAIAAYLTENGNTFTGTCKQTCQ